MNRSEVDNLIVHLTAISNFAKDIHYNCKGDNFYGNHLFADRIADNLNDYIDQLKEICLLGHGVRTLHSSEYLNGAAEIIPEDISFKTMKKLLIEALDIIENTENISKGDENLIGAIAQDIQNNIGLINAMYGDITYV